MPILEECNLCPPVDEDVCVLIDALHDEPEDSEGDTQHFLFRLLTKRLYSHAYLDQMFCLEHGKLVDGLFEVWSIKN